MPILYGTTSDGESLPVQVNEFGQLVAQGLEGPPGPEGQPGPSNPDGKLSFTHGAFTPVWLSDHEEGSALFDYEQQFGAWFRYGDLLAISVRLLSRNDVVTNPRGNLLIGGVPEDLVPLNSFASGHQGIYSVYQARIRGVADFNRPGFQFDRNGGTFAVRDYWDSGNKGVPFSALDGDANGTNNISFSWFWFHADALTAGQVTLDGLM